MTDLDHLEQAARMTHIEAKRATLSDVLQDMGNFAVFAEMISRDEEPHDEI